MDEIPQIFYAPLTNGKADMSNITNIIDSTFECPMRPWGGTEQYNYSPDSKLIAYTCRKKTGYDYAHSTNSDIFIYNIETGETTNISDGIMGYDQNPVFSHDGTIKTPPAAVLLKKACKIESASGTPNKVKVASIKRSEVAKIAELKMPDLNAGSLEAATSMIAGTARSMGITVVDD